MEFINEHRLLIGYALGLCVGIIISFQIVNK